MAHSLCGKRWRLRLADSRQSLMLAQRLGVPEIVARLLAARGIGADEAPAFLQPRLRDQLPDPSRFRDMDRAVERLVAAIRAGEGVAVFGDYDVDGATSAAVLQRFFTAIGHPLRIYIPDRIKEGYGPNAPALRNLRGEGVSVVIAVDCGTTAFEPLADAALAGLDVIVADHHVAEPRLPVAAAIVNPNRIDEPPGFGQLAAVGVTFLLLVALNRALRGAGWYAEAGRREPELLALLDLVALGTICDVVPLTGLNRPLVAQGLKVMARRGNAGIAALADVASLHEAPTAYHAGFVLGPRVNAGGRVGESGLGARLLATDDPLEAATLAARLDVLNGERRAIEQGVLDQAIAQAETGDPAGPVLFVAGEGWHPGVIGIVASRLKERYERPACVVALEQTQDGVIGKGSGRSVRGFDLGAAVIAARQAGLLVNGGGHAMAAGFTVRGQRMEELRAHLGARAAAQVREGPVVPTLLLDGILHPGAVTADLIAAVAQLGPFGSGNPQPRFAIPNARIVHAEPVGSGHVRCVLAGLDEARLKAIAFRCLEGALGPRLLQPGGAPLHLAGRISADNWQGRDAVQLEVTDGAEVYGAA